MSELKVAKQDSLLGDTETDPDRMEYDSKSEGEEDSVDNEECSLTGKQAVTVREEEKAAATAAGTAKAPLGHPPEGPDENLFGANSGVGQSSKGSTPGVPVEDQAKAYVKKRKEEQIQLLKKSLGDKLLSYEAVNAANRRKLTVPYLLSGAAAGEDVYDQEEGDFFNTGDGRAGLMFMSTNLQRKHNVSYSFIPQRKVCTLCPAATDHPVLGTPRGGNAKSPGREVILLTDQSYPPLLPSSSDKNCLRIIRLEFGSLHELATILLELMEGWTLTRGSVVLLFSATHLANVGLAAYIEDLVEAKKRILGALGRDIYISSAPPMLLAGTGNKELISNIFALEEWVSYGVTEEINFYSSSRVALDTILENGRGGGQHCNTSRLRLPASLDSQEKKSGQSAATVTYRTK